METPPKIYASKTTKAGRLLLIEINGKKKWVWEKDFVKPVTGMNEFLSR